MNPRGRPKVMRYPCSVDGCIEEGTQYEEEPAYCPAHRQAARRGCLDNPRPKYDTAFGRVVEAAIALADCDAEDDRAFRLCKFRLRHACEHWKGAGYE